jgi:preprotein translocase subunit SecG
MSILINFLLGTYALVALLMIFVILMQRPKSEGLGAAFGGGVTENLFGAQTTNVLTKFTAWLAGIFFILTFVLSILYSQKSGATSNLRRELMKGQSAAAATTSPPPKPGPSSAVGAPGTVTNPTPLAAAAGPASSAPPADLAVGAAPPAASSVTSTPAASASPARPEPSARPKP